MNPRFFLFALLLALAPLSFAAKAKKPAPAAPAAAPATTATPAAPAPADKPAVDKPVEPEAAAMPAAADPATSGTTDAMSAALSKGLGFDFDKLLCDTFAYEAATGNLVLTGSVDFRSKTINLKCDHLTSSDKDKTMVALGSPVHIEQPGMKATCGKLTYLTDKKNYKLENNPVVTKIDANGKKMTVVGDIITIDTDEKGNNNVNIAKLPGSGRQVVIDMTGGKDQSDKPGAGGKPVKAQKVDNSSMNAIPMPTFSN